MSEMIERVAKALIERGHIDGGADFLARIVIEAMRDPTMAMELAAQASDQRPSTIWGTMIDEALR